MLEATLETAAALWFQDADVPSDTVIVNERHKWSCEQIRPLTWIAQTAGAAWSGEIAETFQGLRIEWPFELHPWKSTG